MPKHLDPEHQLWHSRRVLQRLTMWCYSRRPPSSSCWEIAKYIVTLAGTVNGQSQSCSALLRIEVYAVPTHLQNLAPRKQYKQELFVWLSCTQPHRQTLTGYRCADRRTTSGNQLRLLCHRHVTLIAECVADVSVVTDTSHWSSFSWSSLTDP